MGECCNAPEGEPKAGLGLLDELGEISYEDLGRGSSLNIEGFIRSAKSFSDFFEKAKELTNKERGDAFERVVQLPYATIQFHLLHPRPLQKQKAYHWRIFTPANNQTIWPLQWWIIAPAFSAKRCIRLRKKD